MSNLDARHKRTLRNRARLRSLPTDRPRLTVNRTNKHIYAQIIDDNAGRTLASASSVEADFRAKNKLGADVDAAKAIGQLVAQRAKAAGVSEIRFDRGGFLFHGRIRAVAEGAREGGLVF